MRNLGIIIAFHPFFWTWDFSWQPAWHCYCIEIGPLAVRIGLIHQPGDQ